MPRNNSEVLCGMVPSLEHYFRGAEKNGEMDVTVDGVFRKLDSACTKTFIVVQRHKCIAKRWNGNAVCKQAASQVGQI